MLDNKRVVAGVDDEGALMTRHVMARERDTAKRRQFCFNGEISLAVFFSGRGQINSKSSPIIYCSSSQNLNLAFIAAFEC